MNTQVAIVVAFTGWLLAPSACIGQGTIYLSNLSLQSTGSISVASDSWYAQPFSTGTNGAGYMLNSIQLRMLGASGNPAKFTVMLYTNRYPPVDVYPDYAIAQFTGSTNPASPDIYTYVPDSPITLAAIEAYFIVVTAGTPIGTGDYRWSIASTFANNPAQGWYGTESLHSPDGVSWTYVPTRFAQFAVNADRAPEPTTFALMALGGFVFGLWRRPRR